jgi:hypothetical protein
MRATQRGWQAKKTFESYQNEGAQMSNELESDRATVVMLVELWWRFRVIGADGAQVGCHSV